MSAEQFLDVKQAFDRVGEQLLLTKMGKMGIPEEQIGISQGLLEHSYTRVRKGSQVSEKFTRKKI
jgi:hypothetical protein